MQKFGWSCWEGGSPSYFQHSLCRWWSSRQRWCRYQCEAIRGTTNCGHTEGGCVCEVIKLAASDSLKINWNGHQYSRFVSMMCVCLLWATTSSCGSTTTAIARNACALPVQSTLSAVNPGKLALLPILGLWLANHFRDSMMKTGWSSVALFDDRISCHQILFSECVLMRLSYSFYLLFLRMTLSTSKFILIAWWNSFMRSCCQK